MTITDDVDHHHRHFRPFFPTKLAYTQYVQYSILNISIGVT